MRIRFDASPAIIDIPDTPEFLAALRAAAPGWPFSRFPDDAVATLRVEEVGASYRLHAPEAEALSTNALGVACALMVEVVESCVAAVPSRLWLHCGSVVVNGRLIVLPSHSHAGKSTLVARLASAGYTVFGDDVLPLTADDREGVALGLAPRLRLPLPPRAGSDFSGFVSRHLAFSDGRYAFLDLPEDGLAARGTSMEIGAFVLLDRAVDGAASMSAAPRAAVLQTLIGQNFTSGQDAGELLDRLHSLMDRLPCLVLRYSDLDDAVASIEQTFARWPIMVPCSTGQDAPRPRLAAPGDEGELIVSGEEGVFSASSRYTRQSTAHLRSVDGELFLAGEGDGTIYHLNLLGAGVWNLLEQPISGGEIVDILHGAFPDQERAAVERDAAALVTALVSLGFATVAVADRDQSSR